MPLTPGLTPYQIIAGPAEVFIAPVATAFTAVNTTPSGSWVNLGKTEGGIKVKPSQSVELLSTDQTTGPIKAIRKEEGLDIEFSLAELTLENFAYALNGNTVSSAAGPPAIKSIQTHRGHNVSRYALMVRGDSPYGAFYMQWQVPVVIQQEEPEVEYTKDDKAVLHVVFTALEDLTAATEADRFGLLVAQTS